MDSAPEETVEETTPPPCRWAMDANGFGRLSDLSQENEPCRIPAGFKGWTCPIALQNPDGTPADSDFPPRKAPRMAKHPVEPPAPEAPEPAALDLPALPATTAAVAVPEGLPDLKALMPADGKVTGSTVAMALIAVAGSGAVIKMVKSWLDKRAELQEKELELKAEQQKAEREQQGQCAATHATLEARVAALEAKPAPEAAPFPIDAEELSLWRRKVDRVLTLKAKPEPKPRKKND